MDPVNMMLVGCGMMGARHMRGMAELERTAPGTLRLAAVCDMRSENAEKVAAEAEELLGSKPAVFTSVEDAVKSVPDLQGVDLVTDPRSHDDLTASLFDAGLDVLCEKPLALTVERGRRMVEAAERTGRILATAENNRRDPMNRLAKACMDAGLIGAPNFLLQVSMMSATTICGTAWRHRLAMGGTLFDVAIHVGYIVESVLGPIEEIDARFQLVRPQREGKDAFGNQVQVDVDAEDCFSALLRFENGAQGHWTAHFATPGESVGKRLVIGSEGTLNMPGDRSGKPVEVRRGGETLTGDALPAALPDYALNDIETRLFGERPASYSLQGPETDRKLIAAEDARLRGCHQERAQA